MEHIATISSKGQITLPAAFRRNLNIKAGDRVRLVKRNNAISINRDTYDEELAKLRTKAQTHLKAKGLWDVPFVRARQAADAAKLKEYQQNGRE